MVTGGLKAHRVEELLQSLAQEKGAYSLLLCSLWSECEFQLEAFLREASQEFVRRVFGAEGRLAMF